MGLELLVGVAVVALLGLAVRGRMKEKAAKDLLDRYVHVARDFGFKLQDVDPSFTGMTQRQLRLIEGDSPDERLTLTLNLAGEHIVIGFLSTALDQSAEFDFGLSFSRHFNDRSLNAELLDRVIRDWRYWRSSLAELRMLKFRKQPTPAQLIEQIEFIRHGKIPSLSRRL